MSGYLNYVGAEVQDAAIEQPAEEPVEDKTKPVAKKAAATKE